jgi:hypothetical protein
VRRHLIRSFALVTGLALAGSLAPTTSGAAVARAPLTDEYCDAFGEYYSGLLLVELSVQLFELFSSLPGDEESATLTEDDDIPDVEQVRASYYALLSPKLAELAARLSKSLDRRCCGRSSGRTRSCSSVASSCSQTPG